MAQPRGGVITAPDLQALAYQQTAVREQMEFQERMNPTKDEQFRLAVVQVVGQMVSTGNLPADKFIAQCQSAYEFLVAGKPVTPAKKSVEGVDNNPLIG